MVSLRVTDDSSAVPTPRQPTRTEQEASPRSFLAKDGNLKPLATEAPRSFLASARGVLLLLPLLVLAVGLGLTLVGQRALGQTSRQMASDRLVAQTELTTERINDALGQADPILRQVQSMAIDILANEKTALNESAPHLLPLAAELERLLTARPGVTQAYIGLSDGRFLSASITSEGITQLQLTERGQMETFSFDGGRLQKESSAASQFDPRQRGWFKAAKDSDQSLWSDPYVFYQSGTTGVTKSMRVNATTAPDELFAVVGVDFDVSALTRFMARLDTDDMRSVMFTPEGVILAYPKAADVIGRASVSGAVPTFRDLNDPLLNELMALQSAPRGKKAEATLRLASQEGRVLASIKHLAEGGPRWQVATLSPESRLLAPLRQYRLRSLAGAALGLCVALLTAWILAGHVVAVRDEASRARQLAIEAQEAVHHLGSYQLLDRLGQGGMGEVWRARHRLLAREAAIKLIKPHSPVDEDKMREMQERFRREARAIAALRSRNTIEMFDYGLSSDGTLYYVMELLDGIDLEALVTTCGAQPEGRVIKLLLAACNSLGEAHDAGLVHRDVKPANMMLCRAASEVDVVKVLDFGLVLAPGEDARTAVEPAPEMTETLQSPSNVSDSREGLLRLTSRDVHLGTPGFMSPEQALGVSIDSRSDIYALGCVGFWLLSAELPYNADTPMAMMLKHIQAPIPELRTRTSARVSADTDALIQKCLSKSADDRPQTVNDLALALKKLLIQPEVEPWTDAEAHAWWQEHLPPSAPRPRDWSLPPPSHGRTETLSLPETSRQLTTASSPPRPTSSG